jgi:hypothetical protein
VGERGLDTGDTNFFDSSFDLDKRLAEIGYHQNPDGSIVCDNPDAAARLGVYDMLTNYSDTTQQNSAWDNLTNGNWDDQNQPKTQHSTWDNLTSGETWNAADSTNSDQNTSSASSWDFFTSSNDSSSSNDNSSSNDSSSASCSSSNDSSSSSCSSSSCSSSSCSSSSCSSCSS